MFNSQQKGFISFLTVLLLFFLVVTLVGGFLFFQQQPLGQQLPRQLQLPTPQSSPTPGPTQSYRNQNLEFSFDYPKSWQLRELKINSASSSAKIAHPVLEMSPLGYKGAVAPLKLIYWDNPAGLSLSDLDKKLVTQKDQSIVNADADIYMLSGSGLAVNFRTNGSCESKVCQIYTISRETKVYQLESFAEANVVGQRAVFDGIINSFKFADFTSGEALSAFTRTKEGSTSARPASGGASLK